MLAGRGWAASRSRARIGGMTTRADALARAGRAATLADLLPLARRTPIVRDLLLVLGGAALTAAAAQVAFTTPWTPVPYTLQTGAVLLVGTALGLRRGLASMALYVLVGALGAPVFADGEGGLAMADGLRLTLGYLAGFVLAAAVVGRLAELGWDRSPLRAASLMAIGNLLIYAVGVPVLLAMSGMSLADGLFYGAAVFIPWDAAKIALAAVILPGAWRLAGRRRAD
jgi:biotin transport system substrate-specific component